MSEFTALENPPDPNVPSSSGQHVLMKDQSKIKRALRRTTIVVNSRDRNYIKDRNSNNFRYTFRRPLKNVMSIELMNGCIPSFIYNVNTGWNTFTFMEGTSNKYEVTLSPGFYTVTTFLTELQAKLNAIVGKQNTYTVTINQNTQLVTVSRTSGSTRFGFLFYSGVQKDDIDLNTLAILSLNTPARILGFGLNDYFSDSNGNLKSLLPIDLNNFLNRIYLHLDSDGRNLSRMELGSGRPDCFHIFYITPGQQDYIMLNKDTDHSLFESSPAPIARMTTLELSLRDEFYRLVDLNHRELTLVFEITHLE